MKPVTFALVTGIVFGSLTVLSMLPLTFADRPVALLGAFLSRFAIGFLIPFCKLPMRPYASGALVGLLISLPDAVITKGYVPIIGLGVLGGGLIGYLTGRFTDTTGA